MEPILTEKTNSLPQESNNISQKNNSIYLKVQMN